MDMKSKLKLKCLAWGADLFGAASVTRLDAAPDGHRPTDIMPQAKSIIVLAKAIPYEAVINHRRLTVYARACSISMSMLDTIALQAACWLEEQGGRALAIPADDPYTSWDEQELRGMGEISHRHAAVAAGVGQLGRKSL